VRVSILICTHNRCRTLKLALESLARLDVPDDSPWEVVVVDNASTDATPEVVKDFARRAPAPVRYLREDRLGKSNALNSGVAQCRGEFIAFTDDDARPRPDWLRRLGEVFARQRADWVFGRVLPFWEGGCPRWFSEKLSGSFALLDYGPRAFVVENREQAFAGVNCACRREALSTLGEYRVDMGPTGVKEVGGEDTDMFRRALARGMRVVYSPDVVVEHLIGRARATKGHERRKAWQGGQHAYKFVGEDYAGVPWLLGVPRFYYRRAAGNLATYLWNLLRRDPKEAFWHELQLIRFGAALYLAGRHGFRYPRAWGAQSRIELRPVDGRA
jgi:glycosyltransferase involved in cell wall biosynthesis